MTSPDHNAAPISVVGSFHSGNARDEAVPAFFNRLIACAHAKPEKLMFMALTIRILSCLAASPVWARRLQFSENSRRSIVSEYAKRLRCGGSYVNKLVDSENRAV
ncbi:hypothetical protein JSE7799_01463 [Jannaschia seosinensis]|uniref:Uncharacterized protein n=1 Tax=Jannaschia seosinensis TaxID=313367 RepID=A0A0M7B9X7_9RHOB|nr:hypothetical protein JSE7799_01463 [Jannaschia seosinensis]